MNLLAVLEAFFVAGYALWVVYLAFTALTAKWDKLPKVTRILGTPVLLLGFILDIVLNWTIGLLLGVTFDLTLSQKLSKLKRNNGWRNPVARWICHTIVDPFQVSGRCKK